jgi:acyl-CoA reductase-like NAD-dependent aldehyde dehydrogenase
MTLALAPARRFKSADVEKAVVEADALPETPRARLNRQRRKIEERLQARRDRLARLARETEPEKPTGWSALAQAWATLHGLPA